MSAVPGNRPAPERARVEPVQRTDVEAIAALAREIWHAHYPGIITRAQIDYMLGQRYAPGLLVAELARPGCWWDKLLVGGELAGFASYFLAGEADMKLDKLYVHPRHQRRGHGGAMIHRAGMRARQQGCRRLTLAVNRHNATAIAAYLKHGFRIERAAITDIGAGYVMDDYVMVCEIPYESDS